MLKMMRIFAVAFMLTGVCYASAEAGWDPAKEDRARESTEYFKKYAPSLNRFFEKAYGFAVFPDVYKGGIILLGGGHGKGYVYEMNALVGHSAITQLNVGPQLGGQSFSEIIFFEKQQDLDKFKKGNYELNAQVTAIMITTGMATNIDFSNGVAVFVLPKAGVMAEATVGGQKFSYKPY
jgi:lipid-binding SYLF domain-containing protein